MRLPSLVGGLAVAMLVVATAISFGGTWAYTGSLNVARMGHTATPLDDGTVLIVGGRDSTAAELSSAEIYDPATGTLSYTSYTMNERRA